jgi:hypothetical protein
MNSESMRMLNQSNNINELSFLARNHNQVEIGGHRINFINRTRALVRCCSFCRASGHIITNCNDERLINFNRTLIDKKNDLEFVTDAVSYFKIWLLSLNTDLIKGYAIRYCSALTRHSITVCVVKIIQHIWNVPIIPNNLNVNEYIPFIQQTIMDNNIHYLDLRLSEFLNDIQNYEDLASENKKHNIQAVLCIEIDNDETNKNDVTQVEDCSICYDETHVKDMVSLNCNHNFCGTCIKKVLTTCNIEKSPCCALCRTTITTMNIKNVEILNNIKENLL